MADFLTALSRALPALWEMSVTAAYAAAVVIVLRLLLKKRAPRQVLCLLWLVVFARLLIPFSLESPLSIVPDALPGYGQAQSPGKTPGTPADVNPIAPGQPQPSSQNPSQTQPADGTAAPIVNNPAGPVLTAPGGFIPSAPSWEAPAASPWRAVLAGVWLAGMAAMALYALASYLRIRRCLYDALRAGDGAWEHPAVSSPFILGVLRPRIYLPAGLAGQPRRFILCHERAHLHRLDHIVKPICWAALAIHWFNPAVWAAYILMSRDIEAACDEAVIRRLGPEVKAGYSATLLSLATNGRVPAPCPLAFDEGDAKGRIQNVLRYRRPALWIVVVSALAAVLAAVCLLTDPVAAEEGPDAGPGAGPSPSPDVSSSRPPETLADALLDPWMKEVLDGERTFLCGRGPETFSIHQLRTMLYGDDELPRLTLEVGRLAVMDLDGNGVNEMVVWPVDTLGERDDPTEIGYSTGYFIFLRQGDAVSVHYPGWRSIADLKADGTFDWSGSAFHWGTGSVRFTGNGFEIRQITWCDNGFESENYFVSGQKATREEFEAAWDAHQVKPDAAWYTYTDGVLAPYLPEDMELVGQDMAEAKLWLEGSEIPWLEWHGSACRLGGVITPAQSPWLYCRDFDGDGQSEAVVCYYMNGFPQFDLYEWNGGRPALAASYDTQQLLLKFNQNNVADYNKDTRGLTVTYTHTEGDEGADGSSRSDVSGFCVLPDGFFDGGFEHIRDGCPYAYANQFRLFYLSEADPLYPSSFYFEFEFYLADDTMKDLTFVETPPYSDYAGHYMADTAVGRGGFTLYYDGTQWRARASEALRMDGQDEEDRQTSGLPPLSAPLVSGPADIPSDPEQWYKAAELPGDMIWLYTRNYGGSETLLRWGGSSCKVFNHCAHTPNLIMPELKKLGGADHYGPLAVISHVNSGTGTSAYELVVYDLDAPDPADYTHDWKPLAEDFNQNHSFRFDNDTHVLTLTYRGQAVVKPLSVELSAGKYDQIKREGLRLSITGDQVHYSFDEKHDGDFQLRLSAQAIIGDNPSPLFPIDVTWTLRFNGSGFDVVPGSCKVS